MRYPRVGACERVSVPEGGSGRKHLRVHPRSFACHFNALLVVKERRRSGRVHKARLLTRIHHACLRRQSAIRVALSPHERGWDRLCLLLRVHTLVRLGIHKDVLQALAVHSEQLRRLADSTVE